MAKSANVTIITKWGSRAPTMGEIVKGELAVDLIKHVLYTNDGNQIIEVGGGSVDWSQINLSIEVEAEKVRIIGAIPDQLITENIIEETPSAGGMVVADTSRDIAKMAVIER